MQDGTFLAKQITPLGLHSFSLVRLPLLYCLLRLFFGILMWLGCALPSQFWLLLVLSGMAQMVYLLGLANAYKQSDIGVIYPIARALPVLMVGVGTALLGYSQSFQAWFSFLIITLGCLFVPLESFKQFNIRNYANFGVVWAFIAAVGTAGYSIIDKEALSLLSQDVSHLVGDISTAIFYLGLQFWSISVCFVLYFLATNNRQDVVQAWKIRKFATLAGAMMSATYGLVLYAMTMTENVSYVVALRQMSIVIGIVLGIIVLSEKVLLTRIVGSILILMGLIVVVL